MFIGSKYIVHCSLFIVHCSLFIVHCSLFFVGVGDVVAVFNVVDK
jgi:hypothetical protein